MTGQDVSESSLRDVSRAVYETIKPQIYPAITEEVFEGRSTIKVEFSGESTPYSAAGRYYLRTADEDREVTPEELKVFFGANKYREKWEKGLSELRCATGTVLLSPFFIGNAPSCCFAPPRRGGNSSGRPSITVIY